MATLYVTEPGAQVEKEYHSLIVSKQDEELLRVPLSLVSEVVLVGMVNLTTPAMWALLEANVGVALLTRQGVLLGRLAPVQSSNVVVRRSQYKSATDPDFVLRIARQVVYGKLYNQRTLARRIVREHAEIGVQQVERISDYMIDTRSAADLDRLRGLEGAAAGAYFQVLRQGLKSPWRFDRRARRPPPDPVNSLLSLGYTFLTQNAITALEIAGLDPYEGFFHSDKPGRPALALDLVEEFRSVIVDSVVMNTLNRRMLKPTDFQPGRQGGVELVPAALKKFCKLYSRRLQTEVLHPLVNRRLTYQKCIEVQARGMRKVIEGVQDTYQPFLTR